MNGKAGSRKGSTPVEELLRERNKPRNTEYAEGELDRSLFFAHFLNSMKLTLGSVFLLLGSSALAQEVIVPSDTAARETLRLTAKESTLRFGGLDLFPHAAGQVQYDNNILISHTDALQDVIWTFSPGLTLAAGGVGAYLPGAVTVEQLRSLLYYSPVEDAAKPGRFFVVNYTPSFVAYTENSQYDNVGQSVRLSGGYSFTRLALGLDFDYTQGQIKDSGVGNLIGESVYETRFRSRYDLTDLYFSGTKRPILYFGIR